MTELIGGALAAIGGGMQVASALHMLLARRRPQRSLPDLARAYPVPTDMPPELAELLAALD